jgi:hypothetical protein
MIPFDFCLFPAQFCYIIIYIWKVKSCVHIAELTQSRIESYVTTDGLVGRSVLELSTHLGLTTRFLLLSDSCVFLDLGRSLWRKDGSVTYEYNCCWSSPTQSFSGPSPVGLATILYCLRFYGGGIRPLLHTGYWLLIEVKVN